MQYCGIGGGKLGCSKKCAGFIAAMDACSHSKHFQSFDQPPFDLVAQAKTMHFVMPHTPQRLQDVELADARKKTLQNIQECGSTTQRKQAKAALAQLKGGKCVQTAMIESGKAMCSDGKDNNCDGTTDCQDRDCSKYCGGH